MTLGERIKQVRLQINKSQSEFAARLGIGQAALSAIEKGIRNVTDRNVTLICAEYKVNEQWLRTGTGTMFCQNDEDIIREISSERNLSAFEREFLQVYFRLNQDQKKSLTEFALFLQSQSDNDILDDVERLSRILNKKE